MIELFNFARGALPSLVLGLPADRPGGLALSLILGLAASGCGFLLAVPLGLARDGRVPGVRLPAAVVIEAVRGIPLVYLLLLIHTFGTRGFIGHDLQPQASAAIALTLYATVYQAEIVRAGLRSVTRADVEGALSTGLHSGQVLLFVELPLALRRMVPAFTSLAISMFKDTSVILILGLTDLMGVARLQGATLSAARLAVLYALVALLYLAAAWTLGRLGGAVEHALAPSAAPAPSLVVEPLDTIHAF